MSYPHTLTAIAIGAGVAMAAFFMVTTPKFRMMCAFHAFHHLDHFLNSHLTSHPSIYFFASQWLGFFEYDPLNDRSAMNEIQEDLFLSNRYAAWDRKKLQAYNITHVLIAGDTKFLRPHFPNELKYKQISLRDNESPREAEKFQSALSTSVQFMKEALAEEPRGRVLVHCSAGVSRSAGLIAAYLIAEQKMSTDEAIEWIKKRRKYADPNASFVKQLREWEKKNREQEYSRDS